MKVKLTKTATLGAKKVRVVQLRALSVADLRLLAAASERAVEAPDQAAAEMVAIATGLPAEELHALPVADFANLVEATVALTEAAADRLGRLSVNIGTAAGGMH